MILCDGGTKRIVTGAIEVNHAGYAYAGTSDGEILVFESSSNLVTRSDNYECKLLGKIQT